METATASAPGKLMLLGEHAVLFGQPCIVTAVNLRIQVKVKTNKSRRIVFQTSLRKDPYTVEVPDGLCSSTTPRDIVFLNTAIKKFFEYTGLVFGGYVETKGRLSHSYGLGSSAAVTVALLKALSIAAEHPLSDNEIFDLGYQAVRDVQGGLASGFDVAAATFGGILLYMAGGGMIERIEVKGLPLVTCYSGVKANTVEYVRKVAKLSNDHPDFTETIVSRIGDLVRRGKKLLERRDWVSLGDVMNENHQLLQELGVSTPQLDALVKVALRNGAYGAKLSGAGGGDCMIAIVHPRLLPEVCKSLGETGVRGAKVLDITANEQGVRIES